MILAWLHLSIVCLYQHVHRPCSNLPKWHKALQSAVYVALFTFALIQEPSHISLHLPERCNLTLPANITRGRDVNTQHCKFDCGGKTVFNKTLNKSSKNLLFLMMPLFLFHRAFSVFSQLFLNQPYLLISPFDMAFLSACTGSVLCLNLKSPGLSFSGLMFVVERCLCTMFFRIFDLVSCVVFIS